MSAVQVWWIPQVPMKAFRVDVDSIEQGRFLLNVLADYDLFQYENRVKPDYANVGGLSVLDEDGEWMDLADDEIDDYVAEFGGAS